MLRFRTSRSYTIVYRHPKCLKEQKLWRISESNRWPSACKADALANWANPPNFLFVEVLLVDKADKKIISAHQPSYFPTLTSRPDQSWTGDLYIISVAL